VTEKKRGRPKLDPQDDAPSVNVHWRLSAQTYDRAWKEATAKRLTLPAYVRRILSQKIDRDS